MEAISLKLNGDMLKDIDTNLKKNNYSTRTEFIRTAIRDKLEELSRNNLIKEFMKSRGKAPRKTSDKERTKTRDKVFLEMAKEKGWKI
jgi:Arc/MetJ-type ribon-helix-helix transcriptional regulator